MSQETIERSFEVGSPAKLKLRNIRGQIELFPGEDGVIKVTAIKHKNNCDDERTTIEIEQDDNGQVLVKTHYDNSITNWFGINRPCKVDYTVQVPKNCDGRASGVSSNILARELNGNIDLNTVSGKLDLSELSGNLKISTVSGSVIAENLTGELDANSVSGKIRVMESHVSKAFMKTVSGSMVLQTPLEEGPYTFKGVSGSAMLVVPENTSCSAQFHSVSGRMRTSLPISKDNRHGSKGSMEIQGGGTEVSYKCVSGSFKIVTDENEVIHETKMTTKSANKSVNQMEILKKIEAGEITVDEALKELNA